MVHEASRVILKLIDMEENVGKLYRIFGSVHPADFEFWMQLANEEDRHATLLRTHREYIAESPVLHDRLLASSVETLFAINSRIEEILLSRSNQVPNREDCFIIAIQIEQSAGEIHFQNTVTTADDDIAFQVLQTLYADDHDHADRIKVYMTRRISHAHF